MEMNTFIQELILRFFGDTPWFFRVIRIITVATAIVTGIPTLLESAGVELPTSIQSVASHVIAIAALLSTFLAQLTVTSEYKKKNNIND
jgi:L-asparagine transporter-like permease